MTKYALLNPQNEIDRFEQNVDPAGGVRGGWKRLPVEEVRLSPGVNQISLPTVTTILPDKVLIEERVRDLTPVEIAAAEDQRREDQAQDVIIGVIGKALFAHENRIRALESKPPITVVQFKDALKGMM